jgi:hypothetical protein
MVNKLMLYNQSSQALCYIPFRMSAQPQELQTCIFRTPDGVVCNRTILGPDPYCSLHYGSNCKPIDKVPENPHFEADFLDVVQANDGNWRGFVFPLGVKLPKEIPFAVDARGSRLSSFEQEGVVFKEPVNFSDAIFTDGLTLKGVVFEGPVTFDRCRFEGPVDILNVQCKSSASFTGPISQGERF